MADLNPLSQRLAKWVDNDSIPDAIQAARESTFKELQGKYPKGIPDAILARLLMGGMEKQIDFLRDMVIDALSGINEWDSDETRTQQAYAVLMLEFVREDGKATVLELMEDPNV